MSSIIFEELELQNDNKYKLYMTAVDKALKSFEYTSEWADLISALGKLNKILLNHQKYPVIPRRMKISKRLAQCLHPALPSGVHLKALETYDIMFKTMGTNRLSQELFIYSSGLFPVLTDATINVKPLLLSIYENHFVPLGEKLVPGLNGFLSGVLPGLEVGTDYYDRTNLLLEKVCDGVSPSIFYTCLWECLLSNAAVRLPAILFVLSHFNRHIPMRDQIFLMGNDVNSLVNGLCSCFQDERVLIQRSGLDFLLVGFPMHNTLLSGEHYQTLIDSALITLLRRDMSLNRRLYAWLLGSDVTTGSTSVPLIKESTGDSKLVCDNMKIAETIDQYFKIYSKDLLISAIKNMLKNVTGSNPHDLRPYRILISLLDKSDIGPVILDDILFEVFRLLYLCWQSPGMRATNGSELLKSANMLFSSLEPWYLWDYVGSRFSEACHRTLQTSPADVSDSDVKPVNSGDPSLMEVCNVIVFLLDSLSLEIYSETFSDYLPELFLHVIKSLKEHCDSLNQFQISASLKLGLKILSKVRSPVLVTQASEEHEIFEPRASNSENLRRLSGESFDTNKNASPENNRSVNSEAKTETGAVRDSTCTDQTKKEPSMMDKCLSCYKEFYVTFVCVIRLKLGETRSINSLFQSLSIKSTEMAAKDKAKSLERLLSRILRCNGSSLFSDLPTSASANENICCNCKSRNGYCSCALYSLKETVGLEWQEPVSQASKLLIELSTFQTSVLSNASFKNSPLTNEWESLPDWLISLIVCSCWLGNSCIPLQLVAISTLLDLAFLCCRAESYALHTMHRDSDEMTAASDTIPNQTMPIVFVPLLTFSQLSFMEHRTNVFQVIMHWLWLHLGNPVYEMKCAELICQLQNTLRSPDLVERCIEESLSPMQPESDRIESFQKFVKLWHFSREIIRSTSSSRADDFMYRCMLKVLDNIHWGDNSYLRLEAENWLFHSLLRSDSKRIVDPLLLILLDGKTARIGISHAKILRLQNDENHAADAADANTTFTVHTILGNAVLYHAVRSAYSPNMTTVVNERDSASRSSSITPVATPTPTPSIENGVVGVDDGECPPPYAEYAGSVSSFCSESTIAADTNDVVGRALIEFDFDENGDGAETNEKRKFNTLPKERSEKKCGSYSSLEKAKRSPNQPLISVSDESIDASETKIARNSVSDDGLPALADGCGEFVRSASYSETNIRSRTKEQVDKDRSRSTHQLSRNEDSTTLFLAKAVIEDLITDIVDRVVSDKNSENANNVEKEEEADSAISCTSGCSSVTLEYEKEAAYYCDDEESLLKKSTQDVDTKQTEPSDSSSSAAQFYSHVLLYCDVYDHNRILYVIGKLRDILRVNAKAFLFAASTNLVSSRTSLVNLLAKHRNSVFAKGFHESEKSSESLYKNTTYLEALITVCFYYVRSYYPNFGSVDMPVSEISGNRQVQRECIELLAHIFFHLCRIVHTNDGEIVSSIRQLLNRCKVQRITLHCAWCCLLEDSLNDVHIFIKEIIAFNRTKSSLNKLSNENDQTFQCSYLRLLLSLIALENEIYRDENLSPKNDNADEPSVKFDYVFDRPIIHQPLFFHLIKKLLEPNNRRRSIHERVISFVIACLPYLKKSQAKIVVNVIRLLCCNIETCADVYVKSLDYRIKQRLPVDYMVTIMDGLTILSHYCLLDMHSISNSKTTSANEMNTLKTYKALRIMYGDFPDSMFESSDHIRLSKDNAQESREFVLDNLPKIFASVSTLWNALTTSQQKDHENEAGSLQIIRNQILNLLNPIATHHSIPFFISVAVVWKEKMSPTDNNNAVVVPEANKDQSVLVHLLSSLTSITPDLIINSIYRIIKPQITSTQDRGVDIEISILEMLVHYIKLISITKLTECWNLLVPLLREASNVSIQSQFLLCSAVNHFVQRLFTSPDQSFDKKFSKDLQEIVVKLVELCTQIAGACLEQTTWLRRNLAVRDNNSSINTGVLATTILFGKDTDKNSNVAPQYSVPAQLLLAVVLFPLLDIVFRNQDKEKLNVLFINVMYNLTPYLKNHTKKNSNNFHACSQLLACITSYSYTKKAWKKDIMDLLLDPSLFQMEVESVKHWRVIIANLVSQENSTFRDLLGRVTMSQNNALNLFSSKEQEYEQRSQLLKRLAFTLFCSDYDQFHKHMPDIQEKLAESLKLPQSTPGIQAQVFLCFRVLLLRMSPDKVTSLWPIIITEMVQVMLQMEYELSSEIEENSFHMRIISGSDWPWLNNTNNNIVGHPHWVQLQLAAAKLLKLAVQLPANRLPQFQMYRWAFVGKCSHKTDTVSSLSRSSLSFSSAEGSSADFIPHVVRIASLMNNKFGKVPEKRFENLLPASSRARSVQDLHSFYAALSVGEVSEVRDAGQLENEIETDFVEQLPYSGQSK